MHKHVYYIIITCNLYSVVETYRGSMFVSVACSLVEPLAREGSSYVWPGEWRLPDYDLCGGGTCRLTTDT